MSMGLGKSARYAYELGEVPFWARFSQGNEGVFPGAVEGTGR